MFNFEFSKVTIIQSLQTHEFHSGTELHRYLSALKRNDTISPEIQLIDVVSREDFLAAIGQLTLEAEATGHAPILHLELHGWDDKTGLVFADDSSISWSDLATPLAGLNCATEFNLLVCVGACFGAHFLGALRPLSKSPCFSLIGPTHPISPAEILGSFRDFYRVLLGTLEGDAALTALRARALGEGEFLIAPAEEWFFRLVLAYLEGECTRERLEDRAAKVIAELQREEGKSIAMEVAFQIGVDRVLNFLERAFDAYFMTAEIPVNKSRFAASLVDADKRARQFFSDQGFRP